MDIRSTARGHAPAALRRLAALVLIALLSACASRPGPRSLDASLVAAPGARIVTIYLATSRQRLAPGVNRFSDVPSEQLSFAAYRISIPPKHKVGQIEYPSQRPDPTKEYVVVEERPLDRAAFERAVAEASRPANAQSGIFVHGYNTNLPEAVFRAAQLTADSGSADSGASVLFSWPSTGSFSGYLADKAAAMASRDQLTDLLTLVTRVSGRKPVLLAGHSMGGFLIAESLRQLRLTKRDAVLAKLKVVLAAPDIDGKVFVSQMNVIGAMRHTMTILVSKDDLALAVSSFLAQDSMRVGLLDVNDPVIQRAAKEANVQIIDITGVKSQDEFGHNGFASLATYYPALKKQGDQGASLRLDTAGTFVFNAVAQTLTAPLTIGNHLLARQ